MKYLAPIILASLSLTAALAPPSHADVYAYRISGKVLFKKHQSPPGATVYLFMGTGPINGRIPWVHAGKDGTFSFEFSSVPNNVHVCAHPGETGGWLPLARTSDEARHMKIKLSCTQEFRLDDDHPDQRVELRLK